jgi:galactokinase
MTEADAMLGEFRRRYGEGAARVFWAPGRVNLIGEHTDYNDGFVLPIAIDRGTLVAARSKTGRRFRVHTINLDESAEFDLDDTRIPRTGSWLDYVEGVARSLEARGASLAGADLLIQSNVPVGAGLSSSAALEISVGMALLSMAGFAMDGKSLALAGQAAEHQYVGIKCGIMDQYVAAMGTAGHALLIDCRTVESKRVKIGFDDLAIVVCDTGIRHALASSEYNRRRAECEEGVRLLARSMPNIKSLRDVNLDDFRQYEYRLPQVIAKRCRHVITENYRTLAARTLLQDGDGPGFGRLMLDSHASLRDDYQVSCAELDLLVDSAMKIDGTLGARMTGGGFGGCTVNLVRTARLEQFRDVVQREYARATNRSPGIYIVEPADGAREIQQANR